MGGKCAYRTLHCQGETHTDRVHNAQMAGTDPVDQGKRLMLARERRGFADARAASGYFGWKYDTYIQHERGTRGLSRKGVAERYAAAYHVSPGWLLTGEGRRDASIVPIMGYIGAGEAIEPDFEQVPDEGLEQVELPFPVGDEMIGLQVKGDSMTPAYRDRDVVIVSREQKIATESLIGEEAAVRTTDGHRYLKRLALGQRRNTYNLESLNARYGTITSVGIEWASPATLVVRAREIRRVEKPLLLALSKRSLIVRPRS